MIPCGPCAGCGSEVPWLPPSPPVAGGALVPALSALGVAVVPAPAVVLVTSSAEAAATPPPASLAPCSQMPPGLRCSSHSPTLSEKPCS
jgi:hypothetical protein